MAPSSEPERPPPPPAVSSANTGLALALGGLGLMADVYDISILNLLRPSLVAHCGPMKPYQEFTVFAANVAGALIGQPLFGLIADCYGRRHTFVVTAILTAAASIGCAAAGPIGGLHTYDVLAIMRFLLGVGIGGEYPLAALNAAENADSVSSSFMLSVLLVGRFAGALLGCLVVLVLSQFGLTDAALWRSALGIGAFFALSSAVLRAALLSETPMYKALGDDGLSPMSSQGGALTAMRRTFVGTCGCWLFFDITNYGLGMFATALFPAEQGTGTAVTMLTVYGITAPFLLAGVVLAAVARMRTLLLVGLGLEFLCYLQLASVSPQVQATHPEDNSSSFALLLFALTRGVEAIGPGMAVFIVPAQVFPTRARGTAYGLSASAGRVGAIAGALIVPYVLEASGMSSVMAIMAVVCGMNFVWSWLFVPLYGPAELDAIFRVDSAGGAVERQAVVIQRILDEGGAASADGGGGKKEEATPIVA
mmetsp:Transcript_50631/g.147247  ORF Transcript_50631/g.147247 Transcript_50631/m.147247 type:complete len:480 (+) Transcript_50631:224-1663(+)